MSMADAVARTVDAVSPEDEDLLAGSIALAQLYARHIDQAAAIRAQADKTLRHADSRCIASVNAALLANVWFAARNLGPSTSATSR